MLTLLDNLVRTVLMQGVTALQALPVPPPLAVGVTEAQVRFQPPDSKWRGYVDTLQRNAINVYLVELRENRRLRSNERVRSVDNGVATAELAPVRIDCHYLVTVQSPAVISDQLEPTFDEHDLLYQVATVLIRNAPLSPSRVYSPGSAALASWGRFSDVDLPTSVAPPEGFAGLGEFWQTMGAEERWKPSLHLVVTVPVELLQQVEGGIVTTRITEYRPIGSVTRGETWIQIGGHVSNSRVVPAGPPVGPLAEAWVQLETLAGEPLKTIATDAAGRFIFGELQPGRYQLRVRAQGLGELTPIPQIDVPSTSGSYDVEFV